jgi:pimeloyl-ACP methyl ester carboxylesterase
LTIIVVGQKDIPRNELKLKYTNEASKFMSIMGMNVHYRDEGNPQDSIPLVLIHGTSSSLHTWEKVTSILNDSSYGNKRVITLDMPAFGLTGPNPENKYSYETTENGKVNLFAIVGFCSNERAAQIGIWIIFYHVDTKNTYCYHNHI